MEHRWSVRKPVDMDVLVYHGGFPGTELRARNIGMEGMFIETGALALAKNSVLDVEFTLELAGRSQRYRMPSFVRHVSDVGVGIMFRKFNQELFQALHRLLYSSDDFRAHPESLRREIRKPSSQSPVL